jgi:chorismate dehydratase
MEEITTVLLDYQSRTSVQLAQILLREYWQQPVVLEDAGTDFIDRIGGTTAGLIIGDRALQQLNKGQYVYDLGTAWKQHTGLPFVFATWVANKPLDADFIDAFNMANAYGINHIEEVLKEMDYPAFDMHTYYTQHISYTLDEAKRKGMALFLEKLKLNKQ